MNEQTRLRTRQFATEEYRRTNAPEAGTQLATVEAGPDGIAINGDIVMTTRN